MTLVILREERERERVSGTDARQSGAVFVTNTIDQHVVSSTKLQINTTALCTADGPGHRERGSEREEEAGGSIQIILQLFSFFFSFIHILQPAVATKTHQETRQRNLLCFPSLYINCTVNQSFIKKMPTESVKHLQ